MKPQKNNIRLLLMRWAGIFLLTVSAGLYACDNNQAQQEQDSNLGEEQTSFEVDTTGTAGRGGTDHAMGRANADTSGTGRQMTNDTLNRR
jgi:hypothetical protein